MTDPEQRGQPSTQYTGRVARNDLAEVLGDLARTLQDEQDVDRLLNDIAVAAVDTVPGAEHAGLMVVEARRNVTTRAATAALVIQVDQAQYRTGQGPCLNAMYEQHTVRLSDMATDSRWPDFSREALASGVRSMLSFQLYVIRDNLGALNLYSSRVAAFTDESEQVGLLFAAHAAVAMAGARRQENLVRALTLRDLFGQAKGILIERHKVTGDQAFGLLVRASQHTNTKLADVAGYLVETGELLIDE
jgi:GAF domain-containing protein